MQEELAKCSIVYRRQVHVFNDGYRVWRFDPPGRGEVWYKGDLVLKLQPELMDIFEAALMRQLLSQSTDATWQLVQ